MGAAAVGVLAEGSGSAQASATAGADPQGPLLDYGVGLQQAIETLHGTIQLAARQGLSQARIALEPEGLGEIRIHLTQTAQGLLARVTAETPAAAQALAAAHAELRQSLSSLGLNLARLDIGRHGHSTAQGGDTALGGGGRDGAAGGGEASSRGARSGQTAAIAAPTDPTPTPATKSKRTLNLRPHLARGARRRARLTPQTTDIRTPTLNPLQRTPRPHARERGNPMTTVTPSPTTAALPATAARAPPPRPAPPSTATAEPVNPSGELGKNDFLKLMVAQLQAQNPLEPSNGTEYISELAQFSQLEQTTNIAQNSSQSAAAQRVAQAVALIGHTVSYTDPSTGATQSGPVQSVEITSEGATLTVEGTPGIELAGVTEVS